MPKVGNLLRKLTKQSRKTKKQEIKQKDLGFSTRKPVEAPSEWEKKEDAAREKREKTKGFVTILISY